MLVQDDDMDFTAHIMVGKRQTLQRLRHSAEGVWWEMTGGPRLQPGFVYCSQQRYAAVSQSRDVGVIDLIVVILM